MAKRILLTGATGVVGSALDKHLRAAGHEVRTLSRIEQADNDTISFAPHTIIHAGWAGSDSAKRNDPELLRLNEEVSARLLELAANAGCKEWVAFGSQAEYGPSLDFPIAEDAPQEPDSAYGKTKRALCRAQAEFCQKNGIRFLWFRLFTCTSERSHPNYLIPMLIETLSRGEMPLLQTPHAVWDVLHADDAALGVLAALKKNSGEGVYNLASGVGISVGAMALVIARALGFADTAGLEKQIRENTSPASSRVADTTKFSTDFGWRAPQDFAKCIAEQIAQTRR